MKSLSCVQLFATPCTMQSVDFSRLEYWSGQLFPSSGDLPNPGTEPRSPTLPVDSLPTEPPGKPIVVHIFHVFFGRDFQKQLSGEVKYQPSFKGKRVNFFISGLSLKSIMLLTFIYCTYFRMSVYLHLWQIKITRP